MAKKLTIMDFSRKGAQPKAELSAEFVRFLDWYEDAKNSDAGNREARVAGAGDRSHARKSGGSGAGDSRVAPARQAPARGRLLVLSPGSVQEVLHAKASGFQATAVDDDFLTVKQGREQGLDYAYSELVNFSRRAPKAGFDIVADVGCSSLLQKAKQPGFFSACSRLLCYNGALFTMARSVNDPYAKEHCPERGWTMIRGRFVNFYAKQDLVRLIEGSGFAVQKYIVHNNTDSLDKSSWHVFYSLQKIKKW